MYYKINSNNIRKIFNNQHRILRQSYRTTGFSLARVLATDKVDKICLDIFKERGHEVDQLPSMKEDELCKVIHEYDGLVVRSATKVTKKVLEHATSLQIVGRAGVGVDNIDIAEATKAGVLVMNTPDGNTVSTAQLAVSLLCNLARNIPAANISVKDNKWDRKSFQGTELDKKIIGIIGCGRIGQHVGYLAKGLGMACVGYDPVMTADMFEGTGIKQMSFNELIEVSDFITVHTPLTDDTRNLFNTETIKQCKDGVLFVNCARGGIIEESALLEALKSGKVGGAALDVYTTEPPKEDLKELLEHPQVVCTPHLGASTEEAQINVARDVARQMCNVFDKSSYVGVLNVSYMAAATATPMRPFMQLAETLGAMQAQLEDTKIVEISVSTSGGREINITTPQARALLEAKMIQGLVKHQLPDIVPDIVSAPLIAKEAQIISIVSEDEPEVEETYQNLISTVAKREDGGITTLVGSVFGDTPFIVHFEDQSKVAESLTFKPEGRYALIFENENRPGILREVLKVVHNARINVGNVSIAPLKSNAEKAFCFMTIDEELPSNAMRTLKSLPSLSKVVEVKVN